MGSTWAIRMELTGVKQAVKALDQLSRTVRNKILRPAIKKGIGPIAKDMKQRSSSSVRYGWLKRALGWIVKTTRKGVVVGIAGARYGFRMPVGVRGDGTVIYASPTRYAHLVEYGTVHSAAKPFIRPAWAAGKKQAEATIILEIKRGLLKEAKRVAAKLARKAA